MGRKDPAGQGGQAGRRDTAQDTWLVDEEEEIDLDGGGHRDGGYLDDGYLDDGGRSGGPPRWVMRNPLRFRRRTTFDQEIVPFAVTIAVTCLGVLLVISSVIWHPTP